MVIRAANKLMEDAAAASDAAYGPSHEASTDSSGGGHLPHGPRGPSRLAVDAANAMAGVPAAPALIPALHPGVPPSMFLASSMPGRTLGHSATFAHQAPPVHDEEAAHPIQGRRPQASLC